MIPLHKGCGRCRTGGKRYPLLPTPFKKSHLHLHRLDGFLKKNNNLTKKKDFEDVAGRRGVEPLC